MRRSYVNTVPSMQLLTHNSLFVRSLTPNWAYCIFLLQTFPWNVNICQRTSEQSIGQSNGAKFTFFSYTLSSVICLFISLLLLGHVGVFKLPSLLGIEFADFWKTLLKTFLHSLVFCSMRFLTPYNDRSCRVSTSRNFKASSPWGLVSRVRRLAADG